MRPDQCHMDTTLWRGAMCGRNPPRTHQTTETVITQPPCAHRGHLVMQRDQDTSIWHSALCGHKPTRNPLTCQNLDRIARRTSWRCLHAPPREKSVFCTKPCGGTIRPAPRKLIATMATQPPLVLTGNGNLSDTANGSGNLGRQDPTARNALKTS